MKLLGEESQAAAQLVALFNIPIINYLGVMSSANFQAAIWLRHKMLPFQKLVDRRPRYRRGTPAFGQSVLRSSTVGP